MNMEGGVIFLPIFYYRLFLFKIHSMYLLIGLKYKLIRFNTAKEDCAYQCENHLSHSTSKVIHTIRYVQHNTD